MSIIGAAAIKQVHRLRNMLLFSGFCIQHHYLS